MSEKIILGGCFHTVEDELPIDAEVQIVDGYLWITHKGQDINSPELFPLVNLGPEDCAQVVRYMLRTGMVKISLPSLTVGVEPGDEA